VSKIDDGGAAFPIDSYMLNPNATEKEIKEAQGMTLRDYFAAAALQGILAYYIDVSPAKVAKVSYEYADAMLAARKEGA
jgi:hypothetical protein